MKLTQSIVLISVAMMLLHASPAIAGQTAENLVIAGDVFDRGFQPAEALKFYLPADKLEPDNAKLLLRIARQYRYLMTDTTNQEEKLRFGTISFSYACRAAKLAPNDSDARLSPAISLGKMLPLQRVSEQVNDVPVIKEAADKAIELNPRNDNAWHVLGRWHEDLAAISPGKRIMAKILFGGLPTSTNEEAVACFKRAIEINPNRLFNYIELGRTYAQMGNRVAACSNIEKGLAMPNLEKYDPEMKRRGRETLEKIR